MKKMEAQKTKEDIETVTDRLYAHVCLHHHGMVVQTDMSMDIGRENRQLMELRWFTRNLR